jgi:4-amino-4-deoxy-L-arabinose transferase-like glycosyltransferase
MLLRLRGQTPSFEGRPTVLNGGAGDAFLILILLCFAVAVASLSPAGFIGSGYDDQRYADAALHWLRSFPYLGQTHWELRHPYVLPLTLAFRTLGISQEAVVAINEIGALALLIITYLAVQRFYGRLLAAVTCILLFSTPMMISVVTSTSVEIAELLFVVVSFWSLNFAAKSSKPFWLLCASGLALGLAWQTRETSGGLILLYALSFAFFPIVERKKYFVVAAASALPVIAELLFYYVQTGDIFYRAHVDTNFIHLPSAQMAGNVSPAALSLFNFEVAKSWLPANDFIHVNWIVDPYLLFFVSPMLGFLFVFAVLGFIVWIVAERNKIASPMGLLLTGGIIWFVFAEYVLVIRPEPRYFLFIVYGGTVFAAYGVSHLVNENRSLLAYTLLALLVGTNLLFADVGIKRYEAAYAAVGYLRAHPEPVYIAQPFLDNLHIEVRDPRQMSHIVTRPIAHALELRELGDGQLCPPDAVWCSQSRPSIISRFLEAVGLAKSLSPALRTRLARLSPRVAVVQN